MSRKLIKILFQFCLPFVVICTYGYIDYLDAQSTPFYWEFMNVDIAVQTNGDMLVTETQKYIFTGGYDNQRYRYIPLDKVDEIKDVSVSEDGQLLPSTTGIENNQFWINWHHSLKPPYSRTFVLKYRVVGGLHINDNDAQVYWKAIFSNRKAPIKKARVRVEFPTEFANKIKDFQSFGVIANISKVDAETIEVVAQTSVAPGEELEIKVTFDRTGTDIKTSQWQNNRNVDNWLMLIFFVFWLSLFFLLPKLYRGKRGSGGGSGGSYEYHYHGGGGGGGGGGGCGGGGDGGGGGGGGDGGGGGGGG